MALSGQAVQVQEIGNERGDQVLVGRVPDELEKGLGILEDFLPRAFELLPPLLPDVEMVARIVRRTRGLLRLQVPCMPNLVTREGCLEDIRLRLRISVGRNGGWRNLRRGAAGGWFARKC